MKQFLELRDLLKGDPTDPIWVTNTSNQSDLGAAGEVLISVQGPGNQSIHLEIPQSWLPTDLTLQIDRDYILRSTNFRRAIEKQHIRIVTEEYARSLQKDKASATEQERLRLRKRNVTETIARNIAGTSRQEQPDDVITTAMADDFESTSSKIKSATQEYAPGISYSFKAWADKLTLMPDLEALNEVRVRGTFKRREVNFLVTHLEGKTETVKTLKNMLRKRKK